MLEREIEAYGFPPSLQEFTKHKRIFPSLAPAIASELAVSHNAKTSTAEEFYGNGYYYLRTPWPYDMNRAYMVGPEGHEGGAYRYAKFLGARIEIYTIYNPRADFVAKMHTEEFYSKLAEKKTGRIYEYSDVDVPIITFGGIDYIWYNRKACEGGFDKLMDLVSVELVDRSEPFSTISTRRSDFAESKELVKQYNDIVTRMLTPEEEKHLVLMRFSQKDDFNNPEPVYTAEQEDMLACIEELPRLRAIIENTYEKNEQE